MPAILQLLSTRWSCNRVVGLGCDPISCSFKILIQCSPKWRMFSSLSRCWETIEDPTPDFGPRWERRTACTRSTCYGVYRSSQNLAAFDLNTKSWDSIPIPEGLSCSCRELVVFVSCSCGCLLKTQMWGDRVCVFNINHDLELKMWVLDRETKNWELVVNAGLQNLKDEPGDRLEALLLVGDTFFISTHTGGVFI
ncbi:hypothetical protein AMTR_s00095p00148690 [Amborella trichopoda]|uniref:F-box associated domain-containing protein n=1 Tax=Amborella trichopoda TaxID=13333 RepID=W1NQZ8_AMBTC|nr:hypothetical protein AMTR_s00095p00148690 [Amborella trichopoda]